MQIACLVVCYILDNQWSAYQRYGTYEEQNPNSLAPKLGNFNTY